MKSVIIIGAGSHAAELTDYINYNNQINPDNKIIIIGYLDDDKNAFQKYNFTKQYLGSIEEHIIRQDCEYLLGIANLSSRVEINERYVLKGAKMRGFIHPTALISPSAKIDSTAILSHNVSVGPNSIIGPHNMLNSRCIVGHDTEIGQGNVFSPQVVLSGNTSILNNNFFGTSSITIPGIKMGSNNIVAAGSVVSRNVKDFTMIATNKSKYLKIR